MYYLDRFISFYHLKDYDSLAGMNPSQLQIMVEDCNGSKKESKSHSVPAYYYPIQTFLEANDIASNLTPQNNGTQIIGSAADFWDDVFTETISFRNGSGTETSTTKMYITSDASEMIFHNPAGDNFIWQVAGATKMQTSLDGDDMYIRAGAARKLGFIVDNSSINLGSNGSIQIPVDGGSVGSAANADTDFGDNVGCIGMYLNTIGSGNPTICFKVDDGSGVDNRWVTLTISRTTGSLSGCVLT